MLVANFRIYKIVFDRKAWVILGFSFLFCLGVYGQNQSKADSLEPIYETGNFKEADRLEILYDLASDHPDPEKALKYSEELLQRAQLLDSTRLIIRTLIQKGSALRLKGDLTEALESYFQGVKIAKAEEDIENLGNLYISIAGVYGVMGNRQNTIQYYKNAIAIFKDAKDRNDSISYSSALENLGDEYNLNLAKPDSALIFFKESGAIFKALNYKLGMAYNLGNIGLAYAQLGKNIMAEENINSATLILTELGDYYPISVYLTYMSDIYAARGDYTAAFEAAQQSLKMARQYGLKEQISDANLKLSELHEKKGNTKESLKYYKRYITFRDSVKNISEVQAMAAMQISQKQTELDLKQTELTLLSQEKKNQRNISIATAIALFLIALLALGLYRRYRFIRRTKEIIEKEKSRSDSLLLNILPEETAEELKQSGKVKAKKFDSVTVLFTDFEGFTNFAENLSPEKLVESVDFYFSKFDAIMEKYDLEKIKTVGDSYMCAGGLPFPTEDHAQKMVQAAFEIAAFVKEAKNTNGNDQTRFDIRIGINTGPVVAGVVGTKKFSFDIWGDAVNIASRMESNSEPGKINISENTYTLIKDSFDCEYRGEIKAKNRGMLKMYFVNESKPQ
ncbi:MAG: adenylate/guanylate cyclase domain-containing protein [Aureibaculum sp.]|nr:adenylate/guanylate cyclase domain-containing protein [Aureibaculum sp.]